MPNNYIGKKFHRLTIESVDKSPKRATTWFNVVCDCGTKFSVSLRKLKIGHTKSCGCFSRKKEIVFTSEIDGEILKTTDDKARYHRIFGTQRGLLHQHEAKKIFKLCGKRWNKLYVIHHIDGNPRNNQLDNLTVIKGQGLHQIQHNRMEQAMYTFLANNQLLENFYENYPDLRLETLKDMLVSHEQQKSKQLQ